MKKELKLENPILINGEKIEVMTYDENEITAQMFAEADSSKALGSNNKQGNHAVVAEVDYSLHLYLGMAAIIAVNQPYTFMDLEKIHGKDVMKVMGIGRNFILGSSEGSNQEESE